MPERKRFFSLMSSQRDWTHYLVRSAFLMVLLFWRKEPVYGVLLPELLEEPHVMTQDEELEPLVVAAPAKYTRQVGSFERELAKLFLKVGTQAQIHESPVGHPRPHCFGTLGTPRSTRYKSYKWLHPASPSSRGVLERIFLDILRSR